LVLSIRADLHQHRMREPGCGELADPGDAGARGGSMCLMNPDLPAMTVRLWRADAVVQLDWLTNTRRVRWWVECHHLLRGFISA